MVNSFLGPKKLVAPEKGIGGSGIFVRDIQSRDFTHGSMAKPVEVGPNNHGKIEIGSTLGQKDTWTSDFLSRDGKGGEGSEAKGRRSTRKVWTD